MSATWTPPPAPPAAQFSLADWLRLLLRGAVLGSITFGGLIVMLALRLIERPLFGMNRPVTPYLTQAVCRAAFVILGMGYVVRGTRMEERGAVVANHVSWLDIFALNARKRVYFVSKSEVARWPGIGWLARATGTVFINRDPRDARRQQALFEDRLLAGHKLLFFPEGTSTDGSVVLPFKSTLFQAFFSDDLKHRTFIQPVTLIYHAPEGAPAQFYGWWGDMAFGPHLMSVLAARRNGCVEVIYHRPVRVDSFPNRKSLATHLELTVRAGLLHGAAQD
ncbi:MAG: lysophospholipid acyltransferase family protein [Rhodobacterales bacterium]